MSALFQAVVDEKCMRELHWRYTLLWLELAPLKQALLDAWRGELYVIEEEWGARKVTRLILPFQFEVILGSRERSLSLIHRLSATSDIRDANRARFEEILMREIPRMKEDS